MKKSLVLLTLATLGLPAVGAAQDEMAHDDHEMNHDAMTAEVTAAIEAQSAAMAEAFNAGNAEAAAAFYAEDAISMPPQSAALEGRGAIQAYMAAGMSQMDGVEMTFTTKEVHAMHHHAIEIGGYSVDGTDGTHMDHGKYITVWNQTDDGWKIVRDMWNTSMAGGQ